MKIRMGFVSNSSTSSFLMYGVNLSDRAEMRDFFEERWDICRDLSIDFVRAYEDEYYMGRSLKRIKDEQTFKEFKSETIELVKKFLSEHKIKVEDNEFGIYEEAWQ